MPPEGLFYWTFLPFRRWRDYRGRSRRLEYWSFTGFYAVLAMAFVAVAFALGKRDLFSLADASTTMRAIQIVGGIGWLALAVPSLALQMRRLHDRGRSAWSLLSMFIPYVGAFIFAGMLALPGTIGANAYGPDPIDDDALAQLDRVFT